MSYHLPRKQGDELENVISGVLYYNSEDYRIMSQLDFILCIIRLKKTIKNPEIPIIPF
jgi:hypothetical protein